MLLELRLKSYVVDDCVEEVVKGSKELYFLTNKKACLRLIGEKIMAAYLIGDINVTDPETYAEYAAAVPASSGEFGGKYRVRGPDKCEIAEGDWLPERLVLAEYESMATLKAWYSSPGYAELKKKRQGASAGNLVFVEGARGSERTMAGYVIGDIDVTDPDIYASYVAGVPATVAAFGGNYLVRGAPGEVIEGTWVPKRLVVLEFESLNQARAWYYFDEYADLKKPRQRASNGNRMFANGA